MNKKKFGSRGPLVSEIGMGTYYDIGWIILSRIGILRGAEEKIRALRAGIEGGITLIDTAEIYGSEVLVRKAIEGYNREDLFIVSKVWSNHLRREALIKSLNNSLKRLNTSYLDLYLIHWPNRRVPINETISAMEEMVDQGKIRYFGVSNFSLNELIEARQATKKYDIAAVQINYSLLHRDPEKDIIPYCQKEGIAIMAYYPLGHGRLVKEIEKLKPIMEKYKKTPAQIVLNWLASRDLVFPIPRASREVHVKENLGASGWKLADEDLAYLDKLFPKPT